MPAIEAGLRPDGPRRRPGVRPTAGDPADGPRRSRGTCATSCAAGGERSARAVGGRGREWDERCRACGGAADRGRGSLRDADSVSAPRDASLGGRGGPAPTRDGTRAPGDRAERAGPSRAAGGARRRSTSRDLSTAPAPRRRSLELAAAPGAESLAALERRTRPPAATGARADAGAARPAWAARMAPSPRGGGGVAGRGTRGRECRRPRRDRRRRARRGGRGRVRGAGAVPADVPRRAWAGHGTRCTRAASRQAGGRYPGVSGAVSHPHPEPPPSTATLASRRSWRTRPLRRRSSPAATTRTRSPCPTRG